MIQKISFAQHIRTSSKARRGFRTFKRTQDVVGDQLDEKLSTYGVYTATIYPNLLEIQISEYPVLFMFYHLKEYHVRILCRSIYQGNDLHSYPPRAGNYVAHTLICSEKERFSPMEIFQGFAWNDKSDIEALDNLAGVEMHIEPVSINLMNNDYTGDYFNSLTTLLPSNNVNKQRQKMFMQAVDAILLRQHVIIIDDKEMLVHWMFSLLQIFPQEFIFENINIASLTNTSILTEVCNVLCFEKENEEKIKRQNEYQNWKIIDGNTLEDSYYAKTLLNCILGEKGKDINSFRNQVFRKIKSSFLLDDFSKYARFYYELDDIASMDEATFSEFMALFTPGDPEVEGIFKKIKSNSIWTKLVPFWSSLLNRSNSQRFENYKNIKQVYFIDDEVIMNNYWVDFEKDVIPNSSFKNDINLLLNYYNLIKFPNAERSNMYYSKANDILQAANNQEEERDAIALILKTLDLLNDDVKQLLGLRRKYLDVLIEIKNTKSVYQKVIFTYDNQDLLKMGGNLRQTLQILLDTLSWDSVFQLIKEKKEKHISFLKENNFLNTTPISEIVHLLLTDQYLNEQAQLYMLYKRLGTLDQKNFLKYAADNVIAIILGKETIRTVDDLEKMLDDYKVASQEGVIIKQFVVQREGINQFWMLVAIFIKFPPHGNNSRYPYISILSQSSIQYVLKALDDTTNDIPSGFLKLAEELYRRKWISRRVPREFMEDFSYEDLRSIGAISELKDIRKLIKGKEFSSEDLQKLVKRPWEYFSWKLLCDQLTPGERSQISEYLEEIIGINSPDKVSLYLHKTWCTVICEYVVYMIKYNRINEFNDFKSRISIDWNEYDYVINRLTCVALEGNALLKYFFELENSKRKGSKGPFK